jgi:hypothetical protein
MTRHARSVLAVAAMTALATLAIAPAASAEEVTPVAELVAEAQEVSVLPLDDAVLSNVFSRMTEAQAQAFIDTRLVAEVTETFAAEPADAAARTTLRSAGAPPTVSPMATGCWTAKATRKNTAAAGNTLFTYFTTGYWCSSGSTVTQARLIEAGGETSTPGWRYAGVRAQGAGVYANQGRAYSQHQFMLGVAGVDVQSPTPCARVNGTSAGTYTNTANCSVS